MTRSTHGSGHTRRRRLATGVATFGMLGMVGSLAACGSSGSESGDGGGAPTTTISPIAELMGWTNESPTESRRKQLKIEELVADCMREEGWEYTPVDYSAQDPMSASPDYDLQSTDPEAFGKKYGYGVVYYYELYEEPSLLGEANEELPLDRQGFEDPNAEYVQSLSASEQEEYYASLYGEPMDAPMPMEGDDTSGTAVAVTLAPEDQGCYGVANAEVYPANQIANDPDIQSRMNDYWEDQQNAPELVAAYESWRECLGDDFDLTDPVGNPVETPNDVWSYLDGLKMAGEGLEPEAITQEEMNKADTDYYTMYSDEDGNGVGWRGQPEPLTDAEREDLQATEIELWAKDHACQEEARIGEITMELEQRFVDELVAEFPELDAAS